ncbi:hypothetical protein AN644_02650 [Candidatus Epulonipiscium fishelsonii]|nr:hypothetical protein AN644_02650 [Epulopiscium sp. SCG-C06WGA-EpuloA1]
MPYFEKLTAFPILEHEINRCIISPNEFSDDATPELAQIRRKKNKLSAQIKETMQGILQSKHYQDMLQESVVTIRSDRYCVPVKIEHKSAFKGVVYDQSSSGATVFMEPIATVEMNNQIRILEIKEQDEIEKILINFTEQVSQITLELELNFSTICEIDIIFAKSEFALKLNAREPKLNEKGIINILGARHPLLNPKEVVPIDIRLGKDFTILLITGPNTGGKTVSLKTIGLFTLMAQCGMQIPAKEGSELAIFDNVFTALGDEQSIEQSLSTFSSHMKSIIEILEQMTLNSLVLVDEIGSGTDPIEGSALAMSVLEHLRKQQIRTVATTHYSELKLYALSTEGVENASCEFDVASLRPTYKLFIGLPGKSNAFAISQKLGFPMHLIEDAKSYLKKENVKMEDILVELEYSKKTAEIEKEKASKFREEAERLKSEIVSERQKLEKSRKKILERAQEKANDILREVEMESDAILKEVRQVARKAQASIDEQELHLTKELVKEGIEDQTKEIYKKMGTHPKKKKSMKDISIGDIVLVRTLMQHGTIEKMPDTKGVVIVKVDNLSMKVNVADLEISNEESLISNTPKSTKYSRKQNMAASPRNTTQSKRLTITSEVDVRGLLVDEALSVVDKYLDDAYLSGLGQVTIIHGKGTGALRQAVGNMLRSNPHVSSYRAGKYGEGEHGVTVVEIKS